LIIIITPTMSRFTFCIPSLPIIFFEKESVMIKQILRWSPRIIMILAILFMMMFSIDVFEGESTLGEKLLGFLMHNIPALILAAILFLAWKKELWGGLLILVASVVFMVFYHSFTTNKASLVVMAPFLAAGILFIISYYEGRKK
jgi:hypothetical protein